MTQDILERNQKVSNKSPLPRTLNIASISPSHKFSSYEEQLLAIAKAYRAEESLFLPLFSTDSENADVSAFTTRDVDAVCLDLETFNIQQFRALRAIIRKHEIGAINWNFMHPLNLYYQLLRISDPSVKHWHTDHISRFVQDSIKKKSWINKTIHRLLLSGYTKVICVSEFIRTRSLQLQVWRNQTVVLHFINADRFAPDPEIRASLRQETGTNDRFILLTAAHLIPEKGIDIAIKAMANLPEDTILWILGTGPSRPDLEEMSTNLQLADRIKFWGITSDVQKFMQAADLFLCPSVWEEAAGLVNLEAQASGLPIVASKIGGIPEYVYDERTGLLFEPGNAKDLSEKILRLIHDARLRQQMHTAARQWVTDHFSTPARLPQLLDAYRS